MYPIGQVLVINGQFFFLGQAKDILDRISDGDGGAGNSGILGSATVGIEILISKLKLGNSGFFSGHSVAISLPLLLFERYHLQEHKKSHRC